MVAWLKQQPEVIHLMRTVPPHVTVHGRRPNVTAGARQHPRPHRHAGDRGILRRCAPARRNRRGVQAPRIHPPATKNIGHLALHFKKLVEMGLLTAEAEGYRKADGVRIEFATNGARA